MPHSRQRFKLQWFVIIIAALTISGASPTWCSESLSISSVDVGFDGRYKLGHWIPVSVTIQGGAEPSDLRLSIFAADGDGVPCEYSDESEVAKVSANQQMTIQRYVRMGRSGGALRVVVKSPGSNKIMIDKAVDLPVPAAVGGIQQLGLLFGQDIDTDAATKLQRGAHDRGMLAIVRLEDSDQLPTEWFGYDGVDVIILPTGNAEFCRSISIEQWQAIEQWVAYGGDLILSVAANADEFLTNDHPIARFLPGEFDSVVRRQESTELESYSKKTRVRLDLVWQNVEDRSQRGVQVARIRNPRGLVAAADGVGGRRAPWVIRTSYGFGCVTFLTCDLDVGPVAEWGGRPRLLARLLEDALTGQSSAAESIQEGTGQVTHLGFNDLAGQLRAALDQFSGVRLVPFSLIAAAAVLFILLIGPGDYLLLRKLAPRMEWTWLTFPVTLLAVAALAVLMARSWKGAEARINIVELLDADPATGRLRDTSWAHVYPVAAARYDVTFAPQPTFARAASNLLAWQGLPGAGLGGMQDRVSTAQFSDSYQIQQVANEEAEITTIIEALPIPTWSSRSLSGVWWSSTEPQETQPLQLTRNGRLAGKITNTLPFAIRDASIAYGRFYYQIGTLQPGQEFPLDDRVRPRDFRNRLTRRQFVADKEIASPWSKESLDVPRIMEIMMFHDRAGGQTYTNLVSRYHGELDLTDHLETGSAVLYGRLNQPTSDWKIDGLALDDEQVKRWTFCRLLFPVRRDRPPSAINNP